MLTLLHQSRKTFALFFLLLLPLAGFAAGAELPASQDQTEAEPGILTMPTVTVEGTRIDPLTGSTTFDQQQIKKIPSRNGNTSDLLKLMPGVQMPEGADSSNTAGEIAPVAVSISGGRPYDNNFLIDGVGNNSLLDPEAADPDNIGFVPGHTQELFLHNNLLGEITVLRSNISARYGSFTGGVINAKTIDPAEIFSGNITYRVTSSDWSKFHIDESNQDDFENSISEKYQPDFLKQNAAATLHTPINPNSGLVSSYSILHSQIPLLNLGQKETQKRSSENFFVKYQNRFAGEKTFSVSALYAPYTSDYFIKSVKDSSFQTQGGGLNLTSRLEYASNAGDSEITLAYKNSNNSRRSPDNFLSWRNTVNKSWGTSTLSKEGGYGDIDNEQQTVSASIHHQFSGMRLASSIHILAVGLEGEWSDTRYNRKRDMTIFSSKLDTSVDCAGDNSECVDNEQYFSRKTIYPQDDAEADVLQLATYLEDSIVIKQLTIRPGMRASWDDYLNNTNFAPRLAAGYDLRSNGKTIFIAGANRYYGSNLLTINLAEQKTPFDKYTRSLDLVTNKPLPWVFDKSGTAAFKQSAELKTPFTDEWTVGLRQAFFRGLLELDYLERSGHDLLVTNLYRDPATAKFTKEWRNDGRNHHQEINTSWSRDWSRQSLTITGTWQKTRGDSESYTDLFIDTDAELDELIWYNGKIGTKDELLISDFNRPFRASILYTTAIGTRASFSNTTTYRSPYISAQKIKGAKHTLADGSELDIYEDVTNDQSLIFDWHLAYDVLQKKNLALALTFDIYNVFDHQTNLGGSTTDFELGRQVWLGASCDF